jgi:SAM-dependent methyltransferase
MAKQKEKKKERDDRLFYREENMSAEQFRKRYAEVRRLMDLRPTDRVLDVGCAEGWMTLELAKEVGHAHGFDTVEVRIAEAQRLAAEQGIEKATFEVASVIGYPIEPLSYDVTLFSSVWGRQTASQDVGTQELEALLQGTRRELVARINVMDYPGRLEEILEVCDGAGFDALSFPGKLIVAVRRGVDARIPELPRYTIVPTSHLGEHAVARAAERIGSAGD